MQSEKLWKTAENKKRWQDPLAAAAAMLLLWVGISIFFDFYYALNDDVMMKDILAGVYTGTPSGHNIQMLYPVSAFISLFYRLVRGLPWYGIFLCLCQFGSIGLILYRALHYFKKTGSRLIATGLCLLLTVTLLLKELVFVQYTVTCTLMGAAAVFWFYTSDTGCGVKRFFLQNLPAILQVALAYQIRSEMLLLVFPLICVAGLCKWAEEKPFFTKENAAKYFAVFGGLLTGIVVSQGVHMLAYGSEDWSRFNHFFDSRTELYDFQADFLNGHSYEENEEFFQSIGLEKAEWNLLVNYNFGLDEAIDEEMLHRIAAYAGEVNAGSESFRTRLGAAAANYKYRLFRGVDVPWNYFVIAMYVLVLLAAVSEGHWRIFWELPCLGLVRTGLWLYIIYRGREPERITHSLYLMEMVILLALFLTQIRTGRKRNRIACVALTVVLAGFSMCYIGKAADSVSKEYDRREEVNRQLYALQEYVMQDETAFYFWDVFSSVAYTEKLFAGSENALLNMDIMGGWASKSPLMYQKYAAFGMENMEQALLYRDKTYLVVRVNEVAGWPAMSEWLPMYYEQKGIRTELKPVDTIAVDGEDVFKIYRVAVP